MTRVSTSREDVRADPCTSVMLLRIKTLRLMGFHTCENSTGARFFAICSMNEVTMRIYDRSELARVNYCS